MTDGAKPVQQAAERFWSAWCARDLAALTAAWDGDDEDCSYLSAALEHRLVGAVDVCSLMHETVAEFDVIRMQPKLVCPRRLNANLGSVFAVVDWALQKLEVSECIGGTVRVSAVVRRSNKIWRLCHYAECPVAPLVELRQFYQSVAADGHRTVS